MTASAEGILGAMIARLATGPALALLCGLAALGGGLPVAAVWTAAVTGLCVGWWVTEPIPIPATSLVPFAALPLLGVVGHKEVAAAYGHHLILLLMGGFILSSAMARSGAHRWLAVRIVRAVGGGGRRLVLGFMLACGLCSMWISNTATTLMLLPVALAALEGADERLEVPLLLGLAYAASVGGMGTPVGTPPNVILMAVYKEMVGQEISFLGWMRVGLPAAALLLPVLWLWLVRDLPADAPRPRLPAPPDLTTAQRRVLLVFALTALLWIFRAEPWGGWSGLLGVEATVGDSTIALGAAAAMFILPDGERGGGRLLDWETAEQIPWGLLILFGGGIAIAQAFGASGLSAAIGEALLAAGIASWPVVIMIGAVCLCVTFLTEVTSNTATTTLLMPVLAAAGLAAGIDPALLMVPAALSASCAFMLPVATAPNAIVFGTGRVTVARMARTGLALNLLGVGLITATCALLL